MTITHHPSPITSHPSIHMIRTAFSTVACPSWTLSRVLDHASQWGYDSVEIRSFVGGAMPGRAGGTGFASEPMLTDGDKIDDLVNHEGVVISAFATGIRFDKPVFPPVIGHALPGQHASVEAGRRAVDLAHEAGVRAIRVYPFDAPRGASRRIVTRRIANRLLRVCDHARHKDVQICLENGGAFTSAQDLKAIIDLVNHPLLRVAYDVRTGAEAGDAPEDAINTFGPRLHTLRLRDTKGEGEDRKTVPLGEGDVPNEAFVRAASQRGLDCFAVVNWDAAWLEDLAPAEQVLPEAVERLYGWIGEARRSRESNAA